MLLDSKLFHPYCTRNWDRYPDAWLQPRRGKRWDAGLERSLKKMEPFWANGREIFGRRRVVKGYRPFFRQVSSFGERWEEFLRLFDARSATQWYCLKIANDCGECIGI